jgi:adenosylhomocysteinase
VKQRGKLPSSVISVPEDIDREVARLKLAALRVGIDKLTAEQEHYLASWDEGT